MKIDAECVLADGKEVGIKVDLDYVETMADVFDYVNNEPEAQGSYVLKIKNEDEIQQAIKADALEKVRNTLEEVRKVLCKYFEGHDEYDPYFSAQDAIDEISDIVDFS